MMERNTWFATHDVPLHNNIKPLAAYTAAILPSSCAGSLACVVPAPRSHLWRSALLALVQSDLRTTEVIRVFTEDVRTPLRVRA